MRFRVSQELRQPVGSRFTLELDERRLLLDDDTILSDLRGRADMLRIDRGLLITAKASAHLEGSCSRCLAPLQAPVEVEFQEQFMPMVDPLSGARISAEEAQEAFVIDADLTLDLGEALRQYALMSIPRKPLCRPDCAGLCPTCGANLNSGPCSCSAENDERWRALAALNKTNDQEGS